MIASPSVDEVASSRRPPGRFWVVPALVSGFRALPYLRAITLEPPEGMAVLGVGYNPRDFLSYLSFIRQLADGGSWLWFDGFTTAPHEPRFFLLLHWVLGAIAGLTRVSPEVVLEVSRIPLTFLFFWVLWWFLHPIVDDRHRMTAVVLVGFAGGLEGFVRLFLADLPVALNPALIGQSTWPLFGWSTFQAFYNPLWIAALTLTLVVLRPILNPDGPRGTADFLRVAVGVFVLYWVHPYSAIVVLAVVVAVPLVEWVGERRPNWVNVRRIGVALALPALATAAIAGWQARDPVFRAASGNVFGSLGMPVFWYPLTLGALGILAARGARLWAAEKHAYLRGFVAWIGAVVLLHTSPILNGFHFVFHLHLPLAVIAAPAAGRALEGLRQRSRARRVRATCWAVALFTGFVLVTVEAITDVSRHNLVPRVYQDVVNTLREQPAGNALVPPPLGNMVPAYTAHRVWVGHWFLTPDYTRKTAQYDGLTGDPNRTDELRQLLGRERIRYLVVPADRGARLSATLGDLLEERLPHGSLDVLRLR